MRGRKPSVDSRVIVFWIVGEVGLDWFGDLVALGALEPRREPLACFRVRRYSSISMLP